MMFGSLFTEACIGLLYQDFFALSLFRNHQIVYDAVKLFVFLFVYSLDKQWQPKHCGVI